MDLNKAKSTATAAATSAVSNAKASVAAKASAAAAAASKATSAVSSAKSTLTNAQAAATNKVASVVASVKALTGGGLSGLFGSALTKVTPALSAAAGPMNTFASEFEKVKQKNGFPGSTEIIKADATKVAALADVGTNKFGGASAVAGLAAKAESLVANAKSNLAAKAGQAQAGVGALASAKATSAVTSSALGQRALGTSAAVGSVTSKVTQVKAATSSTTIKDSLLGKK